MPGRLKIVPEPVQLTDLQRFYLRQLQVREKCQDNAAAFIEHCITDKDGTRLQLSAIHLSWIHHISWCWSHGYYALILAPWAHGKSTIVAVGLASFILGREPGARVKIVSNDGGMASKRVGAISRLMLKNPDFKTVFPDCVPGVDIIDGKEKPLPWTQSEVFLQGPAGAMQIEPSLQAKGVFGTGISGRADYLFFDDTCDKKNSVDNPAYRDKVIQNFHQTWMSRLESDGHACAIGTPWHREDLWSHLMQNEKWITLKQAIKQDNSAIRQEVCNAPASYPGRLELRAMDREAM